MRWKAGYTTVGDRADERVEGGLVDAAGATNADCSTGVPSSASSWAMTRSTVIVGAVRPSRIPSRKSSR